METIELAGEHREALLRLARLVHRAGLVNGGVHGLVLDGKAQGFDFGPREVVCLAERATLFVAGQSSADRALPARSAAVVHSQRD